MTNTELKIKGMTCDHCVRAVQRALLSVPGVKKAEVSLKENKAVLSHDGTLDLEAAIRAVEDEGYRITVKIVSPRPLLNIEKRAWGRPHFHY